MAGWTAFMASWKAARSISGADRFVSFLAAAMHNFAKATGVAIARLLQDDDEFDDVSDSLVLEIAEFAERARVQLALDTSVLANAVLFAQPLVLEWKPKWKFAYTIGLALSAKLDFDGFFLGDIIEHLTNEFPLHALKTGERMCTDGLQHAALANAASRTACIVYAEWRRYESDWQGFQEL